MKGTIEVVDAGTQAAPAAPAQPAEPTAPAVPVTGSGDGALAAPTLAAAPTSAIQPEPPGADLGSLTGIIVAVTMVSVASALFARLLRGTVREP
jgi:hypothetical protein